MLNTFPVIGGLDKMNLFSSNSLRLNPLQNTKMGSDVYEMKRTRITWLDVAKTTPFSSIKSLPKVPGKKIT